jgi:hypothetical protein
MRPVGATEALIPINWSLTVSTACCNQPLHVDGLHDRVQAVYDSRYQVPLTSALSRQELNDPHSSLVLGSEAVIAHTLPAYLNKIQPQRTTAYLQPAQMVQTPEEAS